jgi:hypothetical protein
MSSYMSSISRQSGRESRLIRRNSAISDTDLSYPTSTPRYWVELLRSRFIQRSLDQIACCAVVDFLCERIRDDKARREA